ncbi:RNA polymerase sigma factor, sigma-70 family [Paenimyroides aquimaris]|uniref:RNA polymerase sigma factor, sigma-70 family n=1 Tax=Paenimyroides marinum TaxID=1159016 RepID=A0A1H6L8W2_9FLAO|nr:sigma-70 family RNA polymerase sigma factor [Paenimyroides aquimaris]SEH84926.1 RNA polymerase sigma factor, sigma-70 family [Paenimyroides aquimaris]
MSNDENRKNVEEQVIEHLPRIRSFIKGRVPNNEDAEDILQDVFYQFLKTMEGTHRPIELVSSWLYRVAKNTIINKNKKKKEAQIPTYWYDENGFLIEEYALFPKENDFNDPEQSYMWAMVWQELSEALSELPDEQRSVFEWTEFEGVPIKEISQATGISTNTLLSRKHYAVKYLRNRLKEIYDEAILNK